MLILLPMDGKDEEESKLTPIFEAKAWALLTADEGRIQKIEFFDTREEIEEWVEVLVVVNDYEPVMNFIEEQIMVLVAHTQRSIEDVFEAFLFKELMDMPV